MSNWYGNNVSLGVPYDSKDDDYDNYKGITSDVTPTPDFDTLPYVTPKKYIEQSYVPTENERILGNLLPYVDKEILFGVYKVLLRGESDVKFIKNVATFARFNGFLSTKQIATIKSICESVPHIDYY